MRQFVAETLQAEFDVVTACDGQEGLERAGACRPDLIVSDIMMPRLSGDRMLAELRRHPDLASVPVVLLTAKADEAVRLDLLRAGAQDYLLKPFSAQELIARTRNFALLRRAMDELEAKNRALQGANEELEAFSHSVAHDLRNPLAAIRGYSELMLADFPEGLPGSVRESLQTIHTSSRRMSGLIDDLLSFARVSRAELRLAETDVSQVGRDVAWDLHHADPQRKTQVMVESGLTVHGDPGLLRIVLGNLLGNAWKFTSQRTPGRIDLRSAQEEGYSGFTVQDDGAGFDMTKAGRLFQPFQRLHEATEYRGTGIGLATVDRIVRRHGGRVRAEGAVGKGARFTVLLPTRGAR
jgi:signal transduction histidine kinase